MPIVIGIFFLLPLFFGALVEYLCCRLPRRRFWRFLPPVIAVVFLIVAVCVRIQNWESKDVSPLTQLIIFPGGQNQDLFPYYSRPTGSCCHQNLKALPRERTPPPASLPVWCGGGRAENGACPNTDQLPQLFCTRRCHFNGISFKFQICRPQWAGASGITDLVFGPPVGFNQIPRRASPVTGGLGGR